MNIEDKNARRLFLLRHGERVDFTFRDWVSSSFDKSGKYTRKDLNMPETLPQRSDGHAAYDYDTPLTKIGIFQAHTVGQALKEAQLDVTYVYCSPLFRCIQTCDAFLQGCNKKEEIKIRLEPGLFEFVGWHPLGFPDCMKPAELVKAGYNIDLDYQPFVSEAKMKSLNESCHEFYVRKVFVAKEALRAHPSGNVLLVGHSSTLDACSWELVGNKPRSSRDLINLVQKVPYCALLELIQEESKWKITESFPPITHTMNHRFDYRVLFS